MRLLVALAIAFLLASAPGWSDPRATLLMRMRTASGGPYTEKLLSVWSVHDANDPSTINSESQGGRFFIHRCAGAICVGRYFDGFRSFEVDPNDASFPLTSQPDLALRAVREALALSFLAPNYERRGGRIRLQTAAAQFDTSDKILLVTSPDGLAFSVWVDPHTALVQQISVRSRTVALRDYRRVGSYMLPFKERDSAGFSRTYLSRTPQEGELQAPKGIPVTVRDSEPAAFRVAGTRLPIFPCMIGGISARCLIDTGNIGMALSLAFAERIDAPVLGAGLARGFGAYATEVVRAGPLDIANAHFAATTYLALPDIPSDDVDAILGNTIFATTTATLDNSSLRFGTHPLNDASSVAVAFPQLLTTFDARIGDVPAQVFLDTGDDAGLDLTTAFAHAQRQLFKQIGELHVSGVGGSGITQLGEPINLQLGSCTLAHFPVQLTPAMPPHVDGRIGAQLFKRLRLRFNYPKGQIGFQQVDRASVECTHSSH